jgi:hypothetical protein
VGKSSAGIRIQDSEEDFRARKAAQSRLTSRDSILINLPEIFATSHNSSESIISAAAFNVVELMMMESFPLNVDDLILLLTKLRAKSNKRAS